MSNSNKLYHFGASGVSEVPFSEWPNPRDGQHICFTDSNSLSEQRPIRVASLNIGDISFDQAASVIEFVTSNGINPDTVTVTGA